MILLLCLLLTIAPDETQISSSRASYRGKTLVLDGDVSLHHPIGVLKADSASLKKQEETDIPFSWIELSNHVYITLTDETTLSCDKAHFDFLEKSALLSSSVIYKDKNIELLCQIVEAHFVQENTQYTIQSLCARENVQLLYEKDFAVSCGQATYDRLHEKITAYPTAETCQIRYQNESISCQQIEVDLSSHKLLLEKPKGILPFAFLTGNSGQNIHFQSDRLQWSAQEQILILEQNVHLQEESLGSLTTDSGMTVTYNTQEKQAPIKEIVIPGSSHLTHREFELHAPQGLSINGTERKVAAKGSPESPLLFKTDQAQISSLEALVLYEQDGFLPSCLTLQEGIKICIDNKTYGLADTVTYTPANGLLILSAHPQKKVLFQDLEENLLLSASEVHVTIDPVTGKYRVKGIGNVKLSLSEEEHASLKKAFYE